MLFSPCVTGGVTPVSLLSDFDKALGELVPHHRKFEEEMSSALDNSFAGQWEMKMQEWWASDMMGTWYSEIMTVMVYAAHPSVN